jgi:hypothetical protein
VRSVEQPIQAGEAAGGGARAGVAEASVGLRTSRCSRMRRMSAGSSMLAITRSVPPQR